MREAGGGALRGANEVSGEAEGSTIEEGEGQ